jgi:hypothetical protein
MRAGFRPEARKEFSINVRVCELIRAFNSASYLEGKMVAVARADGKKSGSKVHASAFLPVCDFSVNNGARMENP